jgi:hypothetical protein
MSGLAGELLQSGAAQRVVPANVALSLCLAKINVQ